MSTNPTGGYRTKLFSNFPWVGSVNTSLDPSTIGPNELVTASNLIYGERGSRLIRDGINFDWDLSSITAASVANPTVITSALHGLTTGDSITISGSDSTPTINGTYTVTVTGINTFTIPVNVTVAGTTGSFIFASTTTYSVIGGQDFWFGSTGARTNFKTTLMTNKKFYSTTNSSVRTAPAEHSTLTAWSSAITTVSFEVLNNQVLFAVDGTNNVPRKWAGSGSVYDLGSNVTTGDTTNGNPSLANVASFVGVNIGTKITGPGIPANTYVGSYNIGAATIGLVDIAGAAVNATATASGVQLVIRCTTPKATILREHIGRIWANDKDFPDRVHYSTTGNFDEWTGVGDSGALDIGVGDGDPIGVTAIYPPFQGVLYVAKLTKLYRITGNTPMTFQISLVSDGIGCVSHNAVAAVDQDDIVFISQKGCHSLLGTIANGDVQSKYLSKKIQKTFKENWVKTRVKYAWGAYLDNINSVAFAVTDTTDASGNNQTIWFYNFNLESWFSWNGISCQCLFVGDDSDKRRFYLGTNYGRVAKSFIGTNYDISTTGAHVGITMLIKTGIIYPEDDPRRVSGFKKLTIIYGPQGTHTITYTFKIDNYPIQTGTFSQVQTTGVLGVNFILGSTPLGYNFITAPYTDDISGYGRGFQLTLTQSGTQATVEIQGFMVEYEPLGPMQETVGSASS